LRETLLFHGRLDYLYAFQNEKKIFVAADHRYKQVVLFASKGGNTGEFRTRFRLGVGDSPFAREIPEDILGQCDRSLVWTANEITAFSPTSLCFSEFRTKRDLTIFRRLFENSTRLGTDIPGWEITYAREFDMANDSRVFAPIESWTAKGYKSDNFGRWIGPKGEVALPLIEGRMIGQFDFPPKGYVRGRGRTAVWRDISSDDKTIEPQFLMLADFYREYYPRRVGLKPCMMKVTSATNSRTMVACCLDDLPGGDAIWTMRSAVANADELLSAVGLLNSFAFDFCIRLRLAGLNLTLGILEECPVPPFEKWTGRNVLRPLAINTARLNLIHRRFAPEWLRLKRLYPDLAATEWKQWWAVTEANRLRLRIEIDALCADLYGLTPDDFDWIVRDDPKDPKSFYRVERELAYRERLTGLAATAFRAMKEGKWSAEATAKLTNDEFFEIIGIPEMTTGPDPLIRKRDGCHRWKPEEFGRDDPRYGWTWDHCWQDAVALLGSEEAVRKYVEGDSKADNEGEDEPASEHPGPKDLFGSPIPTDLFGSELQRKSRKKKRS
jgi:hypothetical protein